MDTKEIQLIQAEFDSSYWQHNEKDDKVRHISLHIGKLLGKICTYSDMKDHGQDYPSDILKNEVVPDLVLYAAQLANLLDLDLGEAYKRRVEANIERHLSSRPTARVTNS